MCHLRRLPLQFLAIAIIVVVTVGCATGEFSDEEGDGFFDTDFYTDTDAYTLIPDALGPPDTTRPPDTGTTGNNPSCPPAVCTIGTSECLSNNQIRDCIPDINGCPGWTTTRACPAGGLCENNACQTCVDLDGDGRGQGCLLGPDCDDTDPSIYPGAPERCDGKDNNCNGIVDEGFNVGQPCSSGIGECRREGQLICRADATGTTCSAVPGQPTTEVCDGKDNNCNGTIDSGGVCNTNTCVDDQYEPNNSSLTGTPLAVGQSRNMVLCPTDGVDWFRLGEYGQGDTVFIQALFDQADGDLDMEMYVGSTFEAASFTNTSNESINRTLSRAGNVAVRVYYKTSHSPRLSGTPYTIRR